MSGVRANMARSLGGGLQETSTFDWKFSVIQQIGLVLSRKYPSCQASFDAATGGAEKLRFVAFEEFLAREQAMSGFNLTQPLIQKLFAELDPHKKGYLSVNDWSNAFKAFNQQDQLLIELKHALASAFDGADSVFNFFVGLGGESERTQTLSRAAFERGVVAITAERFKKAEVKRMWDKLAKGASALDRYAFREHFEAMSYHGTTTVGTVSRLDASKANSLRSTMQRSKTTMKTATSSQTLWEDNILERLRVIIATSPKSLQEIFDDFDEDGNGFVTLVEFRNAIRRLGLGLTSREIDQIMARIDSNGDGRIDYPEFAAKFKQSSYDTRMAVRAATRMAKLKELMNLHMTSANDAFRYVSGPAEGEPLQAA